MRRLIGVDAALKHFSTSRNPPIEAVRTDGNGLFDEQLTPDDFAARVIRMVRRDGDEALRRISASLDGVPVEMIEVPRNEIDDAPARLSGDERAALERAAERVREFQSAAMPRGWTSDDGRHGERVTPLSRIGAYVPGGTAPLASTVIMTAVPARVAGVEEVVLATPAPGSSLPHPAILAAANIAGVDRVFKIGGAQAIAAMAYGTQTVPAVDLICGPGNVFVTAAKKAVYGDVGIDGLYGPTETLVIVDDTADPAFAAADLLAQAEHDAVAMPVLVTTSAEVADAIELELHQQLVGLDRRGIAEAATGNRGVTVIVEDLDEAITVANAFAPEHLCLMVEDAESYADQVRSAGGLFIGDHSAEVMADYVAGPSHVMPTGGTARFASALSVRHFLRVTPFLNLSESDFLEMSSDAVALARLEGLGGHANAAHLRRTRLIGE